MSGRIPVSTRRIEVSHQIIISVRLLTAIHKSIVKENTCKTRCKYDCPGGHMYKYYMATDISLLGNCVMHKMITNRCNDGK